MQPRRDNPAPRSPLPKRRGRNAARVAATKADKAAKASSKKKKEEDADAAKEKLAEMEVDESFAQRQDRQRRIRRQSDMDVNECDDSDGTEEDFADLMEMEFSGDEEEADGEAHPEDELEILKMQGPKVSFGQFDLSH